MMPRSIFRPLLAAAAVGAAAASLAAPLAAQQRPSAEEAQVLLETRPDLVAKLRERLLTSGMTPDQVRARLRREGYPEHILDPYMRGGKPAAATPNDSVYAAVSALGLGDSLALARPGAPAPPATPSAAVPVARGEAGAAATAADSGRTLFGLSIFQGRTTAFDPNVAGPVDANYALGPGDQLVLILTGEVEVAHTLEVTREGFVVIPQVGQIHVANLTLGQLETVLHPRLDRVYGGVGRGADAPTRFSVSVARLRTNQVFVVGDATVPGSYQVSSAGTALTALYAAGGPTGNGSLRRVEVRRGGQTVDVLDVYDYLLRGDASHDVRLRTGDVLFVPVHGPRVRIVGEVVRPATYEMKPGEALADVVRAAGGFTAEAARGRVLIERILPPGQRAADGRDRVVLDVAAESVSSGGPGVRLEAGDVVRVFPVAQDLRDRIAVVGNVWTPGPQGFTAGMRLSEALRRAGGVRADSYLDDVLVTRLLPDSSRQQLRATLRDRSGAVVTDVVLQENDEVRVFSVAEFRAEQFVTIDGAVGNGGRFPYREGMTLRDLVLLAGGLDERAYIESAEVARVPDAGSGRMTTAQTLRVALDSSYFAARPARRGGARATPGGGERSAGADAADAVRRSAEVLLRPHDRVLILQRPNWVAPRAVVVAGEVKFPGRYALSSRSERLGELIARAGGLNAEAYAAGAYFHRAAGRKGRVGIDLPQALRDRQHQDNLLLQDGDSIFIPAYDAVVDVDGAVNAPIAVAYVPGANLAYYLRAAGGLSRKADPTRAYVTQPNGKVESLQRRRFRPDVVPTPRAGATIMVPVDDRTDRPNYVAAAGAVAQVLGAIVAIVAIARR